MQWIKFQELKQQLPYATRFLEQELVHPEDCHVLIRDRYILLDDGESKTRVIYDTQRDILYYEEFQWATGPGQFDDRLSDGMRNSLFNDIPLHPNHGRTEASIAELRAVKGGLQSLLLRINRLLGED